MVCFKFTGRADVDGCEGIEVNEVAIGVEWKGSAGSDSKSESESTIIALTFDFSHGEEQDRDPQNCLAALPPCASQVKVIWHLNRRRL